MDNSGFIRPSPPDEVFEVNRAVYVPRGLLWPVYLSLIFGALLFRGPTISVLHARADWPVVGLILMIVALMQSSSWAFMMWRVVTGVFYADVRVAFAAAGGYDIGYWLPVVVGVILFVLFASTSTLTPDPLGYFRGPWWFLLLAKIVSDVTVALISYLVFRLKTR